METLKAIVKRHSTRSFSDRPVPADVLNTILAAGCAAPVGMGDYGSLHLTVITGKAALGEIAMVAQAAMGVDRNPLYGATALVLVSSGEPRAPGVQYANAACVVDHMELAATDLGVDSVFIWGALNAVRADSDLVARLGVPNGFTPVLGLAVGYAAEPSGVEKDLRVYLSVNYL